MVSSFAQNCDAQQSSEAPKGTSGIQSRQSKSRRKVVGENELNIEFLQRELYSAQARIAQLDAAIEDKEKRISILQNRINFLEERDNCTMYDKDFQSRLQPRTDCHFLLALLKERLGLAAPQISPNQLMFPLVPYLIFSVAWTRF